MLPILMAASYFTADWIFPRFFYKKKWTPFIFSMIISGLFFILVMRSLLFFIFFPKFYPEIVIRHHNFLDFNIFQHIFYIYSTVSIVLMVKYLNYAGRLEQQRLNLEKQNYVSELALLRSQINPHFLFNTLNNINALIKKDPERSYKSVLKLSEIMRYMLLEAGNDFVSLKNELSYLNSYLGLLSLRLDNPDYISFSISGQTDNIKIAPMLFIPFVENAFKHGDKSASTPGIIISLVVTAETLVYEVVNYTRRKPESTDPTSGIGIPNLRRRLELIYPGSHNLTVIDVDGRYIARLLIRHRR
jgi:LytS/YehU family sensor histidine kinase